MLTETDIHYIVGFLSKITNPNSVDIILGDMVYDNASESKRDVDVTITYKDTKGNKSAFIGLEVKDHDRPLDSTHVEQLCQKLNDMKDITQRGIVSASGFTNPSIKKAQYHKVDLYELTDWDDEEIFNDIIVVKNFTITNSNYQWIDEFHIKYNCKNLPIDTSEFNIQSKLYDENQNPFYVPTLNEYTENLKRNILNQIINDKKREKYDFKIPATVEINTLLSDKPYVKLMNQYYPIVEAIIRGKIICIEQESAGKFKKLIKLNDPNFKAGCTIGELTPGHLVGLVISHIDRSLKYLHIPVSDRLKKKIYKKRI